MDLDKQPINDVVEFAPHHQKRSAPATTLQLLYERKTLVLWVIAAIVATVGQNVFFVKSAVAMPDFAYFIFWSTAIPFVLFFFSLYGIASLMGQINEQTKSVSQFTYFVIGSLTTLNGVFMLFANPHVPGMMQALLGPTIVTIPLSLFFTAVLLRRCFRFLQLFSVAFILGGVVVALIPSFIGGSSNSSGSISWNAIFLFGSVPLVFLTVYEEKVLHKVPVHVAYLLAWSTLYQLITIFLLAPVDLIPDFGTSTPSNFFYRQKQAIMCLFGHTPDKGVCDNCTCDTAWISISLFVLFYVLTSLTQLAVVKYGNAVFMFLATTLVLPITDFAFAFKFVMGDNAEPLTFYNYISLALLVVGIVLYRVLDFNHETNIEHYDDEAERDMLEDDGLDPRMYQTWADGFDRRSITSTVIPSYVAIQPILYRKNLNTESKPFANKTGDNVNQFFTV